MASLLWTRNQNKSNQRAAPSTLFSSNNNLSPRQVANKAYSLAIKKLDKDDKRHKPKYHVRERLLLCNTLSRAEQFLQKRTARTNRRVMSFEEEDGPITSEEDLTAINIIQTNHDLSLQQQHQHHYDHQYHHVEYHSPLSHSDQDNEDDHDQHDDEMNNHQQQLFNIDHHHNNQPSSNDSMHLSMKSLAPMGDNAFVIPQDDEDFLQYPSFLIPNSSIVSPDCRSIGTQNHHISPIASI
ncbi:hypothetical protein BJ944DRAFT_261445 [Cunninghamella echinulata]|nr:hypothetical protein BJ944DRAFT_261445 [Cunninghamella echinulata]